MAAINTIECKSEMLNKTSRQNRKLEQSLGKEVFRQIDNINVQHSGVMEVSFRLAEYLTDMIPLWHTECSTGQRELEEISLLDDILLKSLSAWEEYISHGYDKAFEAFCRQILRQLPRVFDYQIKGKRNGKSNSVWDCTTETLVSWISKNNIKEFFLGKGDSDFNMSAREKGFLLCSHVFSRKEMTIFGVPQEGLEMIE